MRRRRLSRDRWWPCRSRRRGSGRADGATTSNADADAGLARADSSPTAGGRHEVRTEARPAAVTPGARRASDRLGAPSSGCCAEAIALTRDIGLPTPNLGSRGAKRRRCSHAARRHGGGADRGSRARGVRLSHTLTAPPEPRRAGSARSSCPDATAKRGRRAAPPAACAAGDRCRARPGGTHSCAAKSASGPLTGSRTAAIRELSSVAAGGAGRRAGRLMIDSKVQGLNALRPSAGVRPAIRGGRSSRPSVTRRAGRIGGEEFAVLLRNPGPAVALEVGAGPRAFETSTRDPACRA